MDERERRRAQRFPLRIPVKIKAQNGSVTGFSRDISTTGIFCYHENGFEPNNNFEIVLLFPSEVTLGASIEAVCDCKLLRQESSAMGQGFAAQIIAQRIIGDRPSAAV